MTSKIKVDNIENQCGGAVVTKCGGTTTISGTVVKSNTLQASDAGNIISQSGTTITLGASGDTINLASGASQSGFGRTGTVDWQTTPKTTGTFTAVSGEGYFLNTSGGVITANLPAGVAGAIVSFADYAATWQTSAVTVNPNGTDKIGSINTSVTLNTEGQSVTFVFVDSTQGWINTMDSTSNVRAALPFVSATGGTETTCGDYKTHIFTGPGTFAVTNIAPGPSGNPNVSDYLIVAGGGGGGGSYSGGGGAGGFRISNHPGSGIAAPVMSPLITATGVTLSVQNYTVAVGGGGAGGSPGGNGVNSSALGLTAAGGGGGGSNQSGTAGATGGSGGGGRSSGAGNTPPVSPPQGNPGGTSPSGINAQGGGGGAAAAGGNGGPPSSIPGPGGNGSFIADAFIKTACAPTYGTPGPVGSTRYFAGGGEGGADAPPGTGAGGIGGGGSAYPGDPAPAKNGGTNMGGGAGSDSATGGSGIVMIRYKFQ